VRRARPASCACELTPRGLADCFTS
jgi:hypothetical protein